MAVGALAAPAAASAAINATEGQQFSGQVASCAATGPITITWGDGTSSQVLPNGSGAVDGAHTYTEEGSLNGNVSGCAGPPVSFTAEVADAALAANPAPIAASEMVELQVAAGRGDARAVVAEDSTLTYDQLRREVNRAGRLLRELGVGPEQRVLLVLDDRTVFPIVFLRAMRIGAVPVPVSPLDRDENFRHFVADSYAEVVVTDTQLCERLAGVLGDPRIRYLVRKGEGQGVVEFDDALAGQSDELDALGTHRDDVAFWLYSSGSTGKPKGVVHLHHDIAVTCEKYARGVLGLSEDDVTFATTGLWVSPIDMEHVLMELRGCVGSASWA